MVCPLLPAHCRNYSSGKSQLEVLLSSRLGNLPEHQKHAMAHDHAWRQNTPQDSRTRHAGRAGRVRVRGQKFEVFGTSNPELRTSYRAFLARLALRSVALADFFYILLDRANVAIDLIAKKLLDRFACFVHIVNRSIIYPYNSWIYKVNETYCFSASSIEMAGPLSARLPPNLVSHSV
jgi:hypothetical protein